MDFFFNEDALKVMATELSENANLKPTQDAGQQTYERTLAHNAVALR